MREHCASAGFIAAAIKQAFLSYDRGRACGIIADARVGIRSPRNFSLFGTNFRLFGRNEPRQPHEGIFIVARIALVTTERRRARGFRIIRVWKELVSRCSHTHENRFAAERRVSSGRREKRIARKLAGQAKIGC